MIGSEGDLQFVSLWANGMQGCYSQVEDSERTRGRMCLQVAGTLTLDSTRTSPTTNPRAVDIIDPGFQLHLIPADRYGSPKSLL